MNYNAKIVNRSWEKSRTYILFINVLEKCRSTLLYHFQLNFGNPFRPALYREYRGNIMSNVYLPCNTKLSLSLSLSLIERHSAGVSERTAPYDHSLCENVKIVYWFVNKYLRNKEIIVAFYHLNTQPKQSGTFQEMSDRD